MFNKIKEFFKFKIYDLKDIIILITLQYVLIFMGFGSTSENLEQSNLNTLGFILFFIFKNITYVITLLILDKIFIYFKLPITDKEIFNYFKRSK